MGCLALAIGFHATSSWAQQGGAVSANFFAMSDNHLADPWPSIPISSLRLWDSNTSWAEINTSTGVYDWSVIDQWLSEAQAHGVNDIMYTLGRTPTWASSDSTDATCDYDIGSCHPPFDLNADGSGTDQKLKNFITALITHVGPGKIKYWEIWNEPNIPARWTGTNEQLVRMGQDIRAIVAPRDPNALFTTPCPANKNTSPGIWLNTYFATPGAIAISDVVSFHGYIQTGSCPTNCPIPEKVGNLVGKVQSTLASYNLSNLPEFNTEGSWGQSSLLVDPDGQASFAARYYLIQMARGVDRFYWYAWATQDTGHFFDTTTQQLNVAGIAYQQFYNWTVGATFAGPCAIATNNTWTCAFTRPGGYQALAVWNSSGTVTTYTPADPYIRYRDLAGNTTLITGPIPISDKPILVETASPSTASGNSVAPRVHPNPWRSDRAVSNEIVFDQLNGNTTIKIFTLSGHHVKTLPSSSAFVVWDLTNDSGDKVASGIYFYLASNDQGEKATGELSIIK